MSDLERLVGELVDGWSEQIAYFERVTFHGHACEAARAVATPGELRHWACMCPMRLEARIRDVWQPALLVQLAAECSGWSPSTSNSLTGGRPGKPKSKPPTTLDAVELMLGFDLWLSACDTAGATRAERVRGLLNLDYGEEWERAAVVELAHFVRAYRVVLGYEG